MQRIQVLDDEGGSEARFTHPVFMVPGQRLTTSLFDIGAGDGGCRLLRFETIDRDGDTVIRNGFAEVSA